MSIHASLSPWEARQQSAQPWSRGCTCSASLMGTSGDLPHPSSGAPPRRVVSTAHEQQSSTVTTTTLGARPHGGAMDAGRYMP